MIDHALLERLSDHVKLKYQAEDPNEPATKAVLEHFGVLGLPTYVVLKPAAAASHASEAATDRSLAP